MQVWILKSGWYRGWGVGLQKWVAIYEKIKTLLLFATKKLGKKTKWLCALDLECEKMKVCALECNQDCQMNKLGKNKVRLVRG